MATAAMVRPSGGLVAVTRFLLSLYSASRRWMYFFLAASVISIILTYEGIFCLLGCGGSLFWIVASFGNDDKRLRLLMLVGTTLWLIHNVLPVAPGTVVMELSSSAQMSSCTFVSIYARQGRHCTDWYRAVPL